MDQIASTSDMMRSLQQEIAEVKSGELSESKARVVARLRGLQLKTAELAIQYNRLTRNGGKLGALEMPLLPEGNGGKPEEPTA